MGLKQLFDLAGKTALVTGGSRGLGLQMAEALGEMGARVAIPPASRRSWRGGRATSRARAWRC